MHLITRENAAKGGAFSSLGLTTAGNVVQLLDDDLKGDMKKN